jgi:hypothetical protein
MRSYGEGLVKGAAAASLGDIISISTVTIDACQRQAVSRYRNYWMKKSSPQKRSLMF